jgi:hypothetical protein
LVITAVAMAAFSFQKWPDLLIDFGKEPYLAWQIDAGRALYADLAYFNGPLSPYVNALWFRLFGVSLTTLWVCNGVIATAIAGLAMALLARGFGFFAAIAGGFCFVVLCAFGQYTSIGNYNFIAPITHELTHGTLLALLGMWLLLRSESRAHALAAGVCLGLAFLTRAEVFIAAAMGCGGALFAGPAPRGRRAGAVALAALITIAVADLALSCIMPAPLALRGVLGTWPTLLGGAVARLPFYVWGMGLDHPLRSLQLMAAGTLIYVAWLGAAFACGRRAASGSAGERLLIRAYALVPCVLASCGGTALPWRDVARPLPLVVIALIAAELARGRAARPARLAFALFALGMLLKIILYARLQQYGFAHAMPALLLTAAALVSVSAPVVRAAGVGILLALFAGFLQLDARQFSARTVPVGRGADRIWADERGRYASQLLDELARRAPRDATLAVYPEGAMLDFLSRRANPTPYPSLMPTEVAAFGEAAPLRALEEHPPDYVVLAQRDTSEFGVKFFGRDYARAIGRFLETHYRPVWLAGAPPFRGDAFGLLLLERKSITPAP